MKSKLNFPSAIALAILAGIGVPEIIFYIFPSLRDTWLLNPFWGGLLPIALITGFLGHLLSFLSHGRAHQEGLVNCKPS